MSAHVPGMVVTESEDTVRYQFDVQVDRMESLICPKCGFRSLLRSFGTSPALPGKQLIVDRCLRADCETS